jgi:hypothetical protein
MEIKIIRLLSGEEILTGWNEEANIVDTPIGMVTTPEGQINFTPYVPYSDSTEMEIPDRSILWIVNPTQELVDKYKEMTGQIVTPPLQKIVV